MISGIRTQKELPTKSQRREIFENFCRGDQYDQIEGQEVLRFSATKTVSENRQQEVERVDESEIVPNWHVLDSIFGREIEEKVEKWSEWVLFLHYYLF